jgi:site-specific DNA recombinase
MRSKQRLRHEGISNAVIYARASAGEGAKNEQSLRTQTEELARYCRDRNIEVVGEYIEPGVSGSDDQRPVFRRMMKEVLAQSSTVDGILVLTESRFMRNVGEARQHKAKLKIRKISVVAIK